MHTHDEEERWITLPQAAVRMRCGWNRAYALMLAGTIRGEMRDRRWYVREDDVELIKRNILPAHTSPFGPAHYA